MNSSPLLSFRPVCGWDPTISAGLHERYSSSLKRRRCTEITIEDQIDCKRVKKDQTHTDVRFIQERRALSCVPEDLLENEFERADRADSLPPRLKEYIELNEAFDENICALCKTFYEKFFYEQEVYNGLCYGISCSLIYAAQTARIKGYEDALDVFKKRCMLLTIPRDWYFFGKHFITLADAVKEAESIYKDHQDGQKRYPKRKTRSDTRRISYGNFKDDFFETFRKKDPNAFLLMEIRPWLEQILYCQGLCNGFFTLQNIESSSNRISSAALENSAVSPYPDAPFFKPLNQSPAIGIVTDKLGMMKMYQKMIEHPIEGVDFLNVGHMHTIGIAFKDRTCYWMDSFHKGSRMLIFDCSESEKHLKCYFEHLPDKAPLATTFFLVNHRQTNSEAHENFCDVCRIRDEIMKQHPVSLHQPLFTLDAYYDPLTPFQYACSNNDLILAEKILSTYTKEDLTKVDQNGDNCILEVCIRECQDDMLLLALKYDAINPNQRNTSGNTILHEAVDRLASLCVRALLDSGKVRVNIRNGEGLTAKQIAQRYVDTGHVHYQYIADLFE